ncbi:dolichyl-phosphate-mannose-protein mannosyltransferase [Sphingomonas aerolata]|uniref:Dolichyl-phosphate-mannose-protein mannosyltransferase n=1 Tax=Sphingomonas aerolata TaxID=185951 RepID=A0A2T4YPW0_9SPHN|nr:dolichyl-phosphate-mannose-protein mannosyltransferase [Sphingomonas aerolata]
MRVKRVDQHGGSPAAAGRLRAPLMLALMLVAVAAFRIHTAQYSLWYDELASLEFARQPVSRLWSSWMLRETNPPLFYTMLSGWIALVGNGDVVLRLLPIATGIAAIGAAFGLGRAVGDAKVGLLAAALLSLSALGTDLSQQVRGYALAQLAVLLACIGMVHYLRLRTSGGLLLYGIATLVALYTHTTLALFAGLAGVTMLWLLQGDRPAQARWLATNVAVLAGWGWWAMISVRQMTMPVTNIAWIATPSWRDSVAMTAQVYLPFYADRPGLAGTLLLAAMFAALAVCAVRAARPEIRLLAVVTIGAPVLLFAISQRVPIFLPRTLSWASGPELVLVALGVTRIPSLLVARAGGILLLGLSAVGLANWLPNRERDHWDQAAALVERHRPSLVIVGDDAVALAIDHYRADNGQRGPRPLVVQSAGRERWADGLYAGSHLSARAVRDRLRGAPCAVVVGWGPFRSPMLDDPSVAVEPLTHDSAPSVALIRLKGVHGICRA